MASSAVKADYVFHQSWLQTFAHCPEQARDLYGKPHSDDHTDSTALGTAVHAAIEWALTEKIESNGYCPDVYEMQDVALHELSTMTWTYTKYRPSKVQELVAAACETWSREIEPMVDPIGCEVKFRKLLHECDEYTIHLEGSMDCVAEDGVWDWKTAGRPYEEWEYQRWAVQPSAYCFAADVSEFTYGVMIHGKGAQVFPVWRTAEHTNWLIEQAKVAVSYLRADMPRWQLNDSGWWCSDKWCPLFAECKGSHVPADWQDSFKRKYTP